MSASFLITALMVMGLLLTLGFKEISSKRRFDKMDAEIEGHLKQAARAAKKRIEVTTGKRDITGIHALPESWFLEDES